MRICTTTISALALVLAGCVSSQDPQSDYYHPLRGGFVQFEIQPGLYRIEAKSERALAGVDEAARAQWKQRAAQLCGESVFRELDIREGSYEIRRTDDVLARMLPLPQSKIGTRTGYALCKSAGLTETQALLTIEKKGWPLQRTAAAASRDRIGISGVTAIPPQEPGWQRLQMSTFQIAFGKRGPQPDATYIAAVMLYNLPELSSETEFFKHVSEGRRSEPEVGRFKLIRNDEAIAPRKSALCIQYHTVSEDHAAQTAKGRQFMVSEMFGYHCQHPKRKTVGVMFQYSHRHYAGDEDPLLGKKAAGFLEQVAFTDF